ncbi:hypothetical protein GCM10023144_13270 [Pigmentiphaga soli]|uniref:MatE family transporter n=1 Tax=Pigmentiphaga soli TaxID=1007095 RepID=A0ABP8GPI2_9BURK
MATSTLLHDDDGTELDPRKGRSISDLGPSDASDSGSDVAGLGGSDSDTDSAGTGERVSVRPGEDDPTGGDLVPDDVVEEEELVRSNPGDSDDTDAAAAVRGPAD